MQYGSARETLARDQRWVKKATTLLGKHYLTKNSQNLVFYEIEFRMLLTEDRY